MDNLVEFEADSHARAQAEGMKLINFLPFFRFLCIFLMLMMMMIRMWDKFTKQFSHFLCVLQVPSSLHECDSHHCVVLRV